MAEYATSIDIEAPPEIVFAHLVDADRVQTWLGKPVGIDPTPGGAFAVDLHAATVRGEYLEVDPPRRVVISWGMLGGHDLPPGSSRVEFTLTPTARGTALRLVHTGLPERAMLTHAAGWTNYLERLGLAAAGGEPGIDAWSPQPATRERST
jgi:uncharacterized protein YndB with AHSA1/START domain